MNQHTTKQGCQLDLQRVTAATTQLETLGFDASSATQRRLRNVAQAPLPSTFWQTLRCCSCAAIVALVGVSWVIPQSPRLTQRAAPPSLSDQLLEESSPLSPPTAKQGSRSPQPSTPPRIAGSDIGEKSSLLTRVGLRMHAVAARLDRASSFQETQKMQQDILTDLENLLGQTAPDSPGRGKTAAQQSTTPPPSRQQERPKRDDRKDNTGDSVLLNTRNAISADSRTSRQQQLWGSLPKQVRDRLRNISNEQVVPKYRRLVDAYYERLSTSSQEATIPGTTD